MHGSRLGSRKTAFRQIDHFLIKILSLEFILCWPFKLTHCVSGNSGSLAHKGQGPFSISNADVLTDGDLHLLCQHRI